MAHLLIFLLSLYQLHSSIQNELVDKPKFTLNGKTENQDQDLNVLVSPADFDNLRPLANQIDGSNDDVNDDSDDIPFVKSSHDQTEVEFRHPISSVNIDYSRNAIILKFRNEPSKQRNQFDVEQEEKRKSFEKNFMRFGRSPSQDFMRFGKRQLEELPFWNSNDFSFYQHKEPRDRFERSHEGTRDLRGDNFMRFGRSPKSDYMRFGRDPKDDFMRFGRSPKEDFMRFGRNPMDDFMRFGRSPKEDFMRFGRSPSDFMRLGRSPSDFMRLGRSPSDFMRLGRSPSDFMRLGRGEDSSNDFMRFGRSPSDFMRLGRAAQKIRRQSDKSSFMRFGRPDNFMRFGRSSADTADKSLNFMRFGKMDQNFMRFGKSNIPSTVETGSGSDKNNTGKIETQKTMAKEMAKILEGNENKASTDESNPMDTAIKVLYKNQQQHQQEDSVESLEHDMDPDYIFDTLGE